MKLSKPIQAHGQEVTDLNFREPTGSDITRDGFPFKIENGGVRVIDTQAVSRLISSLASIPPSSVGALSIVDYSRAMGEVMGFFADMETHGTS